MKTMRRRFDTTAMLLWANLGMAIAIGVVLAITGGGL